MGGLMNTADELRAMASPSSKLEGIENFVAHVGYPVMVKAIYGRGGRCIRHGEISLAY